MTSVPLAPVQIRESRRSVWCLFARSESCRLAIGIIIIAVMSSVAFFAIAEKSFAILAAFIFWGVCGLTIAKRWGFRAVQIFIFVYLVGVFASLTIYFLYMKKYGVPYYIGGSDDLAYETWAWSMAHAPFSFFEYTNLKCAVLQPWNNSPGYVYLISLLYRASASLGGYHTMIPRFLNDMALGLLAVMTWVLGERIGLTPRTSIAAALFVGLLPIMQFTAAHVFRDMIVSLLTMWVVLIWSNDIRFKIVRSWFSPIVQTVVIAVIVSQFRSFQAAALIMIAGVRFSFSKNDNKRYIPSLLSFVGFLLIITILRNEIRPSYLELEQYTRKYAEYRISMSSGLSRAVFAAPTPLTYLLRILYAFINPVPVLTQDLDRLWLSIGTVIRFLFLPFFALGFWTSVRCRSRWHVLVAFALLFLGTSLISFTSRHIVQFLPYAALIAGIGFDRYRRYRYLLWSFMVYLGFFLALSYIWLKM